MAAKLEKVDAVLDHIERDVRNGRFEGLEECVLSPSAEWPKSIVHDSFLTAYGSVQVCAPWLKSSGDQDDETKDREDEHIGDTSAKSCEVGRHVK